VACWWTSSTSPTNQEKNQLDMWQAGRLPALKTALEDASTPAIRTGGSATRWSSARRCPTVVEMRCNWDSMKPEMQAVLAGDKTTERCGGRYAGPAAGALRDDPRVRSAPNRRPGQCPGLRPFHRPARGPRREAPSWSNSSADPPQLIEVGSTIILPSSCSWSLPGRPVYLGLRQGVPLQTHRSPQCDRPAQWAAIWSSPAAVGTQPRR